MKLLKILFINLILFFSFKGFSQAPTLTPLSKISVLTCGPGEELYSSFGHSAFRVQDTSLGIDVVYNYGVFDDTSKYFYLKFIQGQMDYRLARQNTSRFLAEYEYFNRWVKEQHLNLNLEDRNALFTFLEKNYLPENRVYSYDFFYDNCSTKVWDVLKLTFGKRISLDEGYITKQYTFRQLIHQNLKTNSWSAFGIDLALGSVIDKKASPKEHMYLPNYTMHQLKTSKKEGELLVSSQEILYEATQKSKPALLLTSPLFWLLLLSIGILLVTYMDFKKSKRSRWLDFALFFTTGLAGLLLIFLWFLTDHSQTVYNFNILWAFPLNFFVAFVLLKKKTVATWVSKYLWMLIGLNVLTVLLWVLKIQIFSPLIILILLALEVRYIFLILSSNKSRIRPNP